MPPPIFVRASVPFPFWRMPPKVPDWSLLPTVRTEVVPAAPFRK
jgi:hypothetical protein